MPKMILSLLVCVIFLFTYSDVEAGHGISKEQTVYLTQRKEGNVLTPPIEKLIHVTQFRKTSLYPYYAKKRKKRGVVGPAAYIISYIANRAWRILTTGATRVSPKFTLPEQFEKKGDYNNAVADFLALNPRDIKEFELPDGGSLISGRVGDRRFAVKSAVNGEKWNARIITYQDKAHISQRNFDKIYYVKGKNTSGDRTTP